MCHDGVKFQYWLSSENRVRGERNSAEFRPDSSSLPPGELWEVQLAQYAVKCDTGKAVGTAGNSAPIGIVNVIGFSLPYNVQTTRNQGRIQLSQNFSRIDLGPYSAGLDECCVNPSSEAPSLCVNRPLTGTYRVDLVSGTSGLLVAGKAVGGPLKPWMLALEFTRKS